MDKKRVNFLDAFRTNPSGVPLLKDGGGGGGHDKRVIVQKCRTKGKSLEEINHNSLKYTIDTLQCINQLRSTIAKKHVVYGGTFPIDVPMIQFGEAAGVATTVHHSPSSRHGFETRAGSSETPKKRSSRGTRSPRSNTSSDCVDANTNGNDVDENVDVNNGMCDNFVLKCNLQSEYNASNGCRKTYPVDRASPEDNSTFRSGSSNGSNNGGTKPRKLEPVAGGTYPIDAPCCSKTHQCRDHLRHKFDCKRAVSEGVIGVISGQVTSPSYVFGQVTGPLSSAPHLFDNNYADDNSDYVSNEYCGKWNCLSLLKSKDHLHKE